MLAEGRPAVVIDDEVTSPIRRIRVGREVTSAWADVLVVAAQEEFERALSEVAS